jgi:epsilon-lactone hydrolase
MSSIQSKLWELFLKPLYSRKARLKDDLNIKLARLIVTSFPPIRISRNYMVETMQVNGRNIFIVAPKIINNDKIVFYLHGGAYIAGISWPHWRFIRKLIGNSGVKVAMVDYPVAPENSYTDTIDMVLKSYEMLLKNYLPSQIVFMGDSAGGGLALAIAQELHRKNLPQPASLILLCPWLDVTMSNQDIDAFEKKDSLLSRKALVSAGKHYAKDADRRNPLISPLYGGFDGLAPLHLFAGTHDLLTADARKLNELLKNKNANFHYHEYSHMFHVWMLFPIPEAKKVLHHIARIIDCIACTG